MPVAIARQQPGAADADVGDRPRLGMVCTCRSLDPARSTHEAVTHAAIARQLADIKGFAFGGEYDPGQGYTGPLYFVPSDTVVGTRVAEALGVRSEDDLFGAVVPHAFVGTKAITHALLDPGRTAAEGWCNAFPEAVRSVVLPGLTAFTREDAREAGTRLLEHGPVRIKRTTGIGGRGQFVADGERALAEVLAELDLDEIALFGVVLEQNLASVITHSVGQVRVAGIVASYCGTQRTTPNNAGVQVYGGSELLVVRGDYDALLELALPTDARLAVRQACAYEAAALAHFPGLIASRRNYDVAQGIDDEGRWCSGVLEQSWRIGGASGAEVGALQAFHADAACRVVRASCVELYGDCDLPPPGAAVYFRGVDEHVGPITKYAIVEPHDHAG
jgi:hypothetical protein